MRAITTSAVRVTGLDTMAWVLVLLGLLWVRIAIQGAVPLMQDSLQYISIANNALEGRMAQTSLVHFDAERSFGVVPAPVVTFPPGYALAMAMLAMTGLQPEAGGLVLTIIAAVSCVPLIGWVGGLLGLSRAWGNVVMAAYVVNATVLMMGARVLTDMPFTCLVLLGLALLIRGDGSPGRASWRWSVASGISFALAYSVRYAGMFVIIGVAVSASLCFLWSRREAAARRAVTAAIGCVAVALGMTRNVALVGNWRGGNDKDVGNPVLGIVAETVRGLNRLLLGPGSGVQGGTVMMRIACVALLMFGAAWLWHYARRSGQVLRPKSSPSRFSTGALDLAVVAAVYLACMFYAGLKTVIDYGHPRYLLPVLPLILLLIVLTLSRLSSAAEAGGRPQWRFHPAFVALFSSLLLYAGLNLLLLRSPPENDWQRLVQHIDASPSGTQTAREAVRRLTGSSGVMMANDGQVMGYLLDRPTISLVGPHYSAIHWDEPTIARTVRRFDVKAVVLHQPEDPTQVDGDAIPSDFVRRLLRGDAPSWLTAVHRSPTIVVYAPSGPGPRTEDRP